MPWVKEGMRKENAFFVEDKKVFCLKLRLVIQRGKTLGKIWEKFDKDL